MDNHSETSTGGSGKESFPVSLSKPAICIVGPTASGKTALAQELAQALGGEIVGADSMQVYRGMDIGTGKIPAAERKVPHHGIDLCDPDEPYSAALYQAYARICFKEIDARGKRIVLCGGTGLYVRAAIDAYEFPQGDQVDNPIRESYTRLADRVGAQALWDLLDARDRESAALIHPHNVRRVVRAFEMLEEGISYAEQHRNYRTLKQAIPARFIGLEVTPSVLNGRIDKRVDEMMQQGLVEEVRCLLQHGFRKSITAPQAIGYKELVAALDGTLSFDEAVAQMKTATHRYAKRQRTWFRKDARISWFNADSGNTDELFERVYESISVFESDEGKGVR